MDSTPPATAPNTGVEVDRRLGSTWSDGTAYLGLWAPNAHRVEAVLGDGDHQRTVELEGDTSGCWWGSTACAAGTEYHYRLTTDDGDEIERMDPRSTSVTNSVGRSVVVDERFDWSDDGFVPPPTNEWVIYELHPGTFAGRLDHVGDRLDHLVSLGVNVIELMPVAEFAGDVSWGYNPALPFAVESSYGGPDGLKRLVDRAHGAGIAVVLDVVYNHFGPSDLDLWRFDGWHENDGGGIYFYNDWRAETAWGATRPDYGRDEVRQFIIDNAVMWLTDYHLDGLRLDSTVNIRNAKGEPGPDGDLDDGWSLLADLAATVHDSMHDSAADKVLIAEDLQQDPRITGPADEGGLGFDLQWAAGFVHPVREALESGEADPGSLFEAVKKGKAFTRVVYTESHDEVANGRTRIPAEVDGEEPGGWAPTRRAAIGAVLVMTAPQVPMVFQGQEWADEDWFDDQQLLDWDRAEQRPGTVSMWRDLIALRTGANPAAGGLRGDQIRRVETGHDQVLGYLRWGIGGDTEAALVVVNLSGHPAEDIAMAVPVGGEWDCVFDTAWSGYHPTGSDDTPPASMADAADGTAVLELRLDSYATAIYVPRS